MKKGFSKFCVLFVLIILISIGYSSILVKLQVSGNAKVSFNNDGYNVYLEDVEVEIGQIDFTKNVQSFTIKKNTNTSINYSIVNNSTMYDIRAYLNCNYEVVECDIEGSNCSASIKNKTIESLTSDKRTININASNIGQNLTCKLVTEKIGRIKPKTRYVLAGGIIPESDTTDYTYCNFTKCSKLPSPTRSGYTFDGWYTELEGGTKVTNESVYKQGITVLYAHWIYNKNYEKIVYPNHIVKDIPIANANKHLEYFLPFGKAKVEDTAIVPTKENQESSVTRHAREISHNFNINKFSPYNTEVFISRYFKTTISSENIPVYMTPVMVPSLKGSSDASTKNGYTYQSFSSIMVKSDTIVNNPITFSISVDPSITITSSFVKANYNSGWFTFTECKNNICSLKIDRKGIYTLVINNDQRYSYTILVEEFVDEELQIEKYKRDGYYVMTIDSQMTGEAPYDKKINLGSYSVLYLKKGAFLSNPHERGNFDGMINSSYSNNIKIVGHGIIDASRSEWGYGSSSERGDSQKAINIQSCENVTIDGISMINSPNWTIFIFNSNNVKITNSMSLGYRSTSDGFAIGNSTNVSLSYLYARTGDDLYTIRNMTGSTNAKESSDVIVDNCVAWGKERMFGIVGTVNKSIRNVSFTNDVVIYNDCVLGSDTCGSLAVLVEKYSLQDSGVPVIDNIVFKNITITKETQKAILVNVNQPIIMGDNALEFNNIRYNSSCNKPILLNSVHSNYAIKKTNIKFTNISQGSTLLTASNISPSLDLRQGVTYYISNN